MLQQVLQNLGLSDKEARVYLALLELGPSSAYEISKKTGIHHSTVYMEAESLKKKSLISKYEQSKKIKFMAESPSALNLVIDRAKKKLLNKEIDLNFNLAELNSLFLSSQDKALVRFYEGEAGIKAIENDAIEIEKTSNQITYSFTNLSIMNKIDPDDNFAKTRVKRKKILKMIYTDLEGIQHCTNKTIMREARYLPYDKYPFDASAVIAPNHSVRLYSLKNGFKGFWIQNPDIANTLKMMWDVFWEIAEEEK